MKAQHHGIKRIINATKYSSQGLAYAWKNESAFREEVVIGFFLVIAAFFLGDNNIEIALLIGSCFFVVITEIINSAIEAVVDRTGSEHHKLSGAAKDMGSAAVMISIALLLIIWGLLLSN